MATFNETITRIATELRRSNLTEDIKFAINDAIKEAAQSRFWFNEMLVNFPLVANTESYPDINTLVTIDAVYYNVGSTRYNVDPMNFLDLQDRANGNAQYGLPDFYSRYEGKIYLDPIPSVAGTLYLRGHGQLDPFPFVGNDDTNPWLNEGELYIRALAKRNLLRDVIRDYGEARAMEAISEDYKQQLENATAEKSSTGEIRSTQF